MTNLSKTELLKAISTSLNEGAIWHPKARLVRDSLEASFEKSGTKNHGTMVIGEAGMGKTTIAKAHARRMNRQYGIDNDEQRTLPVVYTKVKENSDCSSLINSLLESMNVPFDPQQTYERRRKKLLEQLQVLQVKQLVFDEFRHLMRESGSAATRKTLEFIKLRMEGESENQDYRVSVVFLGVKDGEKLFVKHKELEQRFKRNTVRLLPFKTSNESEREAYQYYLYGIGKKLEDLGVNAQILKDPQIKLGLLIYSSGIPRLITQFIEDVLDRKTDLSVPVTLKDFVTTYNYKKQCDPDLPANPFAQHQQTGSRELSNVC